MNPTEAITWAQLIALGGLLGSVIVATAIILWRVWAMKENLVFQIATEREQRLELEVKIAKDYTSYHAMKDTEIRILTSIGTLSSRIDGMAQRIDRVLETK